MLNKIRVFINKYRTYFLLGIAFVWVFIGIYTYNLIINISTDYGTKNINVENVNVNNTDVPNIVMIEDKAIDYINNQDFESAHKYYDGIIAKNGSLDEVLTYKVRKALIYFNEGESKNKQELYFAKGKKILEEIKNEKKQSYGEYFRVLGYGYEIIRDYNNALANYEKALQYGVNEEHILSMLGGLAHTHMLTGNPHKAETYLKQALSVDKNNVFINRLHFRNLGTLGKYEESIKIGESLLTQIENKENLAEIYYSLSNLSFSKQDLNKSIDYAKKCIDIKKDYGLCHFSLAKSYFYSDIKNNLTLARIEANKAIVYSGDSAVVLEFIGFLNEATQGIDKAIITHRSNLDYIVDNDTNLFDTERIVLKQRLLIHLTKLYSRKKDEGAMYYLDILKKTPLNYNNVLLIENELLKENGGDFAYLLKNNDLSDYLVFWKINKIGYNNFNEECSDADKECINSTIYNNMYNILFVDNTFRKVDLGPLIAIINIKEDCTKNNDILDNSIKSMCLVFTSSHNYLLEANKKDTVSIQNVFNK